MSMNPYWYYWFWVQGQSQVTYDIPLDWRKRYLVTGYLTATEGDEYAHVYVYQICNYNGSDLVSCGILEGENDKCLLIQKFIDSAIKVSVKLKTGGGYHKAEGMVYEL